MPHSNGLAGDTTTNQAIQTAFANFLRTACGTTRERVVCDIGIADITAERSVFSVAPAAQWKEAAVRSVLLAETMLRVPEIVIWGEADYPAILNTCTDLVIGCSGFPPAAAAKFITGRGAAPFNNWEDLTRRLNASWN